MSFAVESARIEPDIMMVSVRGSITVGRESQNIVVFLKNLLQENEKKLVFDLAGLEHLDSSGVELIFECFAAAKSAGAQLRLAAANKKVSRLFHITRLDTILAFYPTVAEAIESLGSGLEASG